MATIDPSAVNDGLKILGCEPLPGDLQVTDTYIVLKYLTKGGEVHWSTRSSNTLTDEELLGLLVSQSALIKRQVVDGWEGDS